MSSLAELDKSNVVDIDLGSAEFKANAHRHTAEWARRPPFYVSMKLLASACRHRSIGAIPNSSRSACRQEYQLL
jgi:hypothetical protein